MVPARMLVAFVLLSSILPAPAPLPDAPRVAPADDVYQLLTNPGLESYDAPYGQFQGIDCQVASAHLESLGARSILRREFVDELAAAIPDLHPDPRWRQASIAMQQAFMQNSRGPRGR